MLKVEHLTKVYDDGTVALEDVSFEVPAQQFLAVIGLSGSGKSTLLRCINRLIEPTDGRILWNDVDITGATQDEMRRIRRRIGMVFQHFNLVNRSKVITNVLSGRLGYVNPALSIVNRFPKSAVEKAYQQLERVGLQDKAYNRADELSGGQQQRVGVARALAAEASILLMDEPFGALDEMTRELMQQEVLRIWEETGTTVIFVTHSIPEAVFLSSRVLVMSPRPGRIADEVTIDLATTRDEDTREDGRYYELITEVREALRREEQL